MDLNFVKMEISILSCKNIIKFLNSMLKLYSNKFFKVFNIYTKIISYLEILNFKIYYLTKRVNLKLLISGFQNQKFLSKTLHIHIVEVHNIWLPKCLLSINIFYLRCGHSFKVDYYALGILLY